MLQGSPIPLEEARGGVLANSPAKALASITLLMCLILAS